MKTKSQKLMFYDLFESVHYCTGYPTLFPLTLFNVTPALLGKPVSAVLCLLVSSFLFGSCLHLTMLSRSAL